MSVGEKKDTRGDVSYVEREEALTIKQSQETAEKM